MPHHPLPSIMATLKGLATNGRWRVAVSLILIPLAGGSLYSQEPELRHSPPNPAFLEWQAKQEEARQALLAQQALGQSVEPIDNRFGYIPPPYRFPPFDGPATQIEAMVKAGVASYAASYDLRNQGILSPIRNQSPFGTCWAFAAFASLESNIKKTMGTTIDFSEWHTAWFAYNPINNMPSFTKGTAGSGMDPVFDLGGHVLMATALLSRGTGPVLETHAPYQNNKNYPQSSLPKGTEPNAATVKNVFMLETSNRDTVKGLLQDYGAVAMSVLWPDSNEAQYYNSTTKAFRYVQGSNPTVNHGVNIVGWNDNYSKENFPAGNQPVTDGAWIVRNSWGPTWGESGYFYMSYDTNFLSPSVYIGSMQLDEKIYQYDFLGITATLGYGQSAIAWFSNIFTANSDGRITDVAFYSSTQNASYEITIKTGVTGNPGTGSTALGPQKGNLPLPGYHRIKLTNPVDILGGDKFAVIVKLTESHVNNGYPITISHRREGYSDGATATSGVGFASSDGTSWGEVISAAGLSNVIICLKAFAEAANLGPKSISFIEPPPVVFTREAVTFQVAVSGLGNRTVTWTATGGSIDSAGKFQAPATPQTVTVTATSVQDTTVKNSVNVSIRNCFDGCSSSNPQLLGIANAYGQTPTGDFAKYDLNGDGKIDDKDLEILFKGLGWQ